MFQVKGDQILGARSGQEDSFQVDELDATSSYLMLVADGMGGHAGGAEASRLVSESFVDAYHGDEGDIASRLRDALFYANEQVAQAIENNPDLADMGTTLLAAVLDGDELSWISVGDSILWLFRDGKLMRLNDDHSMGPVIDGLVEIGRMTAEQAAADPRRNQLRSVVTGEEIPMIDLCREPLKLKDGDVILLATDGILSLTEQALCGILGRGDGTEDVIAAIFDQIEKLDDPLQDNTTVVVAAPA